jgi:hypothetical protein
MPSINFIRVVDGKVDRKGNAPAEDFYEMKRQDPRYRLDDGRPLAPLPVPKLPEPAPVTVPSLEELTDAIIKFAAGDGSGIDAIKAKRKG